MIKNKIGEFAEKKLNKFIVLSNFFVLYKVRQTESSRTHGSVIYAYCVSRMNNDAYNQHIYIFIRGD